MSIFMLFGGIDNEKLSCLAMNKQYEMAINVNFSTRDVMIAIAVATPPPPPSPLEVNCMENPLQQHSLE